jgi:hypothetical protein
MRILIDVDGVALDLMTGFIRYVAEYYGEHMRYEDITRYSIGDSPALREIDARIGFYKVLARFLNTPRVYEDYVPAISGAFEGISALHREHDVAFVTATMA